MAVKIMAISHMLYILMVPSSKVCSEIHSEYSETLVYTDGMPSEQFLGPKDIIPICT